MAQYNAKGCIEFSLGIGGIEYRIYDRDYYLRREKGYVSEDSFERKYYQIPYSYCPSCGKRNGWKEIK